VIRALFDTHREAFSAGWVEQALAPSACAALSLSMSCSQCVGIEESFDDKATAASLERYRRNGPRMTTRLLVDGLAAAGVKDRTLLDVGGGVGAVHLALLSAGARAAVDVDASKAFLRAAQEEAERRGFRGRISYRHGNFADVAHEIEPADIVSLDRVICCFDDCDALLGSSARKAQRTLGLVYPRDWWLGRAANRMLNVMQRLRGTEFRTFVHRRARVEGLLAEEGFRKELSRRTLFWEVALFQRTR
jgi:SAM-dependent methyltransferase